MQSYWTLVQYGGLEEWRGDEDRMNAPAMASSICGPTTKMDIVRRDLNVVGLEMYSQKDQPPPGRSQTDPPNQSSRQPRLTKLRFQETPDASGERMEVVSKGSYRTHNRPSLHK